jgi:hypothetical protein
MNTGKRKSNVEIITEFIEFGSPLNQAFVIEAVNRYAKELLENEAAYMRAMEGHIIHPSAWLGCARDWQKANKDAGRPKA